MSSPVVDLLASFAKVCRDLDLRWYLFDAQAALLYGSARLTGDVDVTAKLERCEPRHLVDALVSVGFRLRVRDVDGFIARTRVIPLLHEESRMPLDVVLAGPGIEDLFLERANTRKLTDTLSVPVACAEDLVAMKILAGRPKDIDDAEAIVGATANALDVELIRATVRLLEEALDQSDLIPVLERLLKRTAP